MCNHVASVPVMRSLVPICSIYTTSSYHTRGIITMRIDSNCVLDTCSSCGSKRRLLINNDINMHRRILHPLLLILILKLHFPA